MVTCTQVRAEERDVVNDSSSLGDTGGRGGRWLIPMPLGECRLGLFASNMDSVVETETASPNARSTEEKYCKAWKRMVKIVGAIAAVAAGVEVCKKH